MRPPGCRPVFVYYRAGSWRWFCGAYQYLALGRVCVSGVGYGSAAEANDAGRGHLTRAHREVAA